MRPSGPVCEEYAARHPSQRQNAQIRGVDAGEKVIELDRSG